MSAAINRRLGLGFLLGVDPAGASAFQNVAGIVDGWKEGAAKAKMGDVTIYTDLYEQFAKGQINPGELSMMLAYDPDNTITQLLVTLLQQQLPAPNWQISYPSGSLGAGTIITQVFLAHLSSLGREINRGKLVTCEVTLTKTGAPGF